MNRASTVWASIRRALNRNAFSGGNGSACACARPGPAARKREAATAPMTRGRQGPSRVGIGLRGDPVEVGGQAIAYGDSDYFRKFVGVMPADDLFDAWIEPGPRLDGERDFGCRFDFAAPVIE